MKFWKTFRLLGSIAVIVVVAATYLLADSPGGGGDPARPAPVFHR